LTREGYDKILPEMQMMMQDLPADDGGLVNYKELLAQLVDKKLYLQEDLCWTAFRDHDKLHTGIICASEVADILSRPHEVGASRGAADAMQRKLDKVTVTTAGTDGKAEAKVNFMTFVDLLRTATLEEVGMGPETPKKKKHKHKHKKAPTEEEKESESPRRVKTKPLVGKRDVAEDGVGKKALRQLQREQAEEPVNAGSLDEVQKRLAGNLFSKKGGQKHSPVVVDPMDSIKAALNVAKDISKRPKGEGEEDANNQELSPEEALENIMSDQPKAKKEKKSKKSKKENKDKVVEEPEEGEGEW